MPLALAPSELVEIRDTLVRRIREGLATHGAEIKALPAYLGPATPTTEGRAIVLDTGGTNMRAAIVELLEGRLRILAGPVEGRVPGVTHRVSRVEFFGAQAELISSLSPETNLPVGYCFSYPSLAVPSRDARLIRWTKGIDVPDVEGALVGEGLLDALAKNGVRARSIAVLNDTVAALLAGSLALGSSDVLALIAGTGSNLACFVSSPLIPKLDRPFEGEMAINFETGNFHPPHLLPLDDAVAASLPDPTAQRFEKAVAGYYLPHVFLQLTGRRVESSAELVSLANSADPLAEPARSVLARSADLIAAALAAVATLRDRHQLEIIAEGSLFFGDPKFRPRVEETLARLSTHRFMIHRLDHANLAGSAAAALTR